MCAAQTGLVLSVSTFPEFVESDDAAENAFFEGSDLAHPLLASDTVVRNSVKLSNDIAIITGSNMSGKTTMIRTVGVCSVLAYTGGLVPATSLKLGRMRVMSSMRIVDSIEDPRLQNIVAYYYLHGWTDEAIAEKETLSQTHINRLRTEFFNSLY